MNGVKAMGDTLDADLLVVGGGLAGLLTALGAVQRGLRVVVVERDTRERLGGLARWAFGGMALVGTPLQARAKIPDHPERALADWLRWGGLNPADPADRWPLAWASHYVERSRPDVHDWLRSLGLRFLPAVSWVERGLNGEGNSLPRYHVLWGSSRLLTLRVIAALEQAASGPRADRLTLLCGTRVTALDWTDGAVSGAQAVDEASGRALRLRAPQVVLATGGLNGTLEGVRAHWPAGQPCPGELLNGAHPFADGALHRAAVQAGGRIAAPGAMWNYAAGIPHPQPHFAGHGLSLVPPKSALWLDASGRRIGPSPLVTGFDTPDLCRQVAAQAQPWTWQLLNRRIARRELAISGAEHNPRIRERQWLPFLAETLLGSGRLLDQLLRESPQVLAHERLDGLAAQMNALSGGPHVDPAVLQATVDAFDAHFVPGQGLRLANDDQLRRIQHARQWRPDRLRTCAPAPLQRRGDGPFVAIQLRLITRKSLGGLVTDLHSRVLDAQDRPLPGLYAVGEAAGFGGGNASGRRSLEGTFLPGCILTAQAAARHLGGGASAA
ncbi:FAD-dependent oxidoreductase [Ideonella sp. B508-1]|uniref:FAD-dependent oxidoreductase n=1 Tax=Ideonella sp. B508-1 TaxID=137716 RepID=UPI0003490246|nr:FAD-dependent oxidoreductase [Ideonella sp. B508-1]